jgi:hypothetical protein
MITRISTGSSTVAQLLDGVLHKLVDEVVGYRGVVRPPLSHRTEPATQEPDQPHGLHRSPYCSARAPVPWLVDQRRPSVE